MARTMTSPTPRVYPMFYRRVLAAFTFCLMICALLLAGISRADILLIERIKKEQAIPMPARGSSMAQVRQEYGDPERVRGPVGEPPITTWIYPRFSCYFERRWVIDCVAHKVSPLEKGPKPVE